MELELRNHPSQARHRIGAKAGQPMFDDAGEPVPLFPDQRAIHLDGLCIAYVNQNDAGVNINFLKPIAHLPPGTEEKCRELVAADPNFQSADNVSAPKPMKKKTKKSKDD